MSRNPKPLAKHLAEGTRPHYVNRDAPEPPGLLRDMEVPPELSDAQKAVWGAVLESAAPNQLRAQDAPTLVAFCIMYCQLLDAENDLRAHELTANRERGETKRLMRGPKGSLVPHPAVKILRDCSAEVARLSSLLAITPPARERIHCGGRQREFFDDGSDAWRNFPDAPNRGRTQ
jgi:P27 family predicted phage terminase small subunit